MKTLKGYWRVYGGVIPNLPPEQCEIKKAWGYDSDMYEQDKATPQDQSTEFVRLRDEALEFYSLHCDPAAVNQMTMEFVWM